MKDLQTVGLNPFAIQLVAESLLKSPLAPLTVGKPLGFFFPVRRSDCAGWAGVRLTVEAMRPTCDCDAAVECKNKADNECRRALAVRAGAAPSCPWCDRQGHDNCQHADEARTCKHL